MGDKPCRVPTSHIGVLIHALQPPQDGVSLARFNQFPRSLA